MLEYFYVYAVLFGTGPQAKMIRTSVDFFFHVAHICTFF